ncbi:unnamed protein product [Phaeothamnion confervicola]
MACCSLNRTWRSKVCVRVVATSGSLMMPMIHSLRGPMMDFIQHTEMFLAAASHNGANADVPGAMLPVYREMLRVFTDKWGDDICTHSEGPRRQPKGSTKVQVLATALDPRMRSFLGVPATPALSERLFSGAGLTVTPRRNWLTDHADETRVFLFPAFFLYFFLKMLGQQAVDAWRENERRQRGGGGSIRA